MGIIDFLRKKLKKEEKEQGKKAVEFNGLPSFIATEKDDIKETESDFTDEIKALVSELIKELESGLVRLKGMDLSQKRESEKIKLVVKENLHYFIQHVERLISGLKAIDYKSMQEIKKSVNLLFLDFEKKSINNYQKSTILIGEELGNITEAISKFFKSFKEVIEKNNEAIEKSSVLGALTSSLLYYNKLEEEEEKINKEIKACTKKIEGFWGEIAMQNEKIENLKESKEYKEFLQEKDELDNRKKELDSELSDLKSIIDFKALGSAHHSDEKKMRLVNEYRDNFKESFLKYPDEALAKLIEEGGLGIKEIKDKISGIKKIQDAVNNMHSGKDLLIELHNEIDRIKFRMIDAENNKVRQEKLKSKINEGKAKIKEKIKEDLDKIKVELTP